MNFPALALALSTAEQQFKNNTPLEVQPDSATPSISDIATLNAFIMARPGAIRAAQTVLTELNAQGYAWAGTLLQIVSAAPGALATAAKDLPFAIGVLKEFAPAPTGITGEDPNDRNFKDR